MILRKILGQIIRHKYPVIINSVPKSGTNLLLNIVKQIPGTSLKGDFSLAGSYNEDKRLHFILSIIKVLKPGSIYSGHVPYFKEYAEWLKKNRVKQIFIYRDPRDVTVSLYHYIMNKVPKHDYFDLMTQYETDSQRLLAAIKGIGNGKENFELNNNSIPNIGLVFGAYSNWLSDENTICIPYEKLNDTDEGIAFVKDLFEFLNINNTYSNTKAKEIWENGKNPSLSHTFRKGKSGNWRQEYQSNHIEAFSSVFSNELLEKYGYKE